MIITTTTFTTKFRNSVRKESPQLTIFFAPQVLRVEEHLATRDAVAQVHPPPLPKHTSPALLLKSTRNQEWCTEWCCAVAQTRGEGFNPLALKDSMKMQVRHPHATP